jgi:hypothetical protein
MGKKYMVWERLPTVHVCNNHFIFMNLGLAEPLALRVQSLRAAGNAVREVGMWSGIDWPAKRHQTRMEEKEYD